MMKYYWIFLPLLIISCRPSSESHWNRAALFQAMIHEDLESQEYYPASYSHFDHVKIEFLEDYSHGNEAVYEISMMIYGEDALGNQLKSCQNYKLKQIGSDSLDPRSYKLIEQIP